jgi:hypothetical protein
MLPRNYAIYQYFELMSLSNHFLRYRVVSIYRYHPQYKPRSFSLNFSQYLWFDSLRSMYCSPTKRRRGRCRYDGSYYYSFKDTPSFSVQRAVVWIIRKLCQCFQLAQYMWACLGNCLACSSSKYSIYFPNTQICVLPSEWRVPMGCVMQCVIRQPYRFALDQRKRMFCSDVMCDLEAVWMEWEQANTRKTWPKGW